MPPTGKRGIYLLRDLGDTTLLDFIQQQKQGTPFGKKVTNAYKHVIEAMPGLQVRAAEGIGFRTLLPASRV